MPLILARLLTALRGRGILGILKTLTDPHAAIGVLGADKLANALGAGPLVDALNPNNLLRRGLVTGEGRGEGLSSYVHGFKMGLNPFDLISQGMAQNIEVGVRQQGFHGGQANRASEASGKLVNDLGIDYQKAIELVTENMRHGTEAMKDFVSRMHELKDIAKDTGLSVTDLVDNMQDFVQKSTEAGGRRTQGTAQNLYSVLESQLGISKLGGSNKTGFEQFLVTKGKELTTLGGGNPLQANTPEGLRRVPQGLQRYVEQILAAKPPDMTNAEWASILINSGEAAQFFPGLNNDQLTLLFDHASRKGGLASDFNKQQIKVAVARAKTARRNFISPGQQNQADAIRRDMMIQASTRGGMGYTNLKADQDKLAKLHQASEIDRLDQTLQDQNVSGEERRTIRNYLRGKAGTAGYDAAEKNVLDNLQVILKLDAAETRKFLSSGQITKNQNLDAKNRGGRSTRTSGATTR